jgi:DNA-directed RNA polymerase sigma subunit (sigma70/sigma32)
LNAEERQAIAVRWLTLAGRATTESNIRMVAQVATPYAHGSKLDRVAIRALNSGFRPTHRLVSAMLDATFIDDPEPSKEQVNELVAMVVAHRQETGTGPEWKQISKHFGWTKGQVNVVMRRLERKGIIKTEYGVKGSLDVGPNSAR